MNGPDNRDQAKPTTREMSRQDIGRHVARGRDLRAEHLAQWGRNLARTWRSLFHRGHLLPADVRARARLIPSAQH